MIILLNVSWYIIKKKKKRKIPLAIPHKNLSHPHKAWIVPVPTSSRLRLLRVPTLSIFNSTKRIPPIDQIHGAFFRSESQSKRNIDTLGSFVHGGSSVPLYPTHYLVNHSSVPYSSVFTKPNPSNPRFISRREKRRGEKFKRSK